MVPLPFQLQPGGPIVLENVEGQFLCAAKSPIAVEVNGNEHVVIYAENTKRLTLTGAAGGYALTVSAAQITALSIPSNTGNVALTCANLATLTFAAALSGTTSFACTGAKLSTASVNAIVAAVDAAGTSTGTLDLSGGTSAAPTNDVTAAAGSFSVTIAGVPANDDYLGLPAPLAGGGNETLWMSIDGGGTRPGYAVIVDLSSGDTDTASIATNIAAAAAANSWYNVAVVGSTLNFTAKSVGQHGPVAATGFTINSEDPGVTAHNSHVAALQGRSWTVTTN